MKNFVMIIFIALILSYPKREKCMSCIFNPNFNITFEDIERNGFKFPGNVDVPIFEKNYNDTLVSFQFEEVWQYSNPVWMSVEFEFPDSDSSSVIRFFEQNSCRVLAYERTDYSQNYHIQHTTTQFEYRAGISQDEFDSMKTTMHISFSYPER